MQIAHQTLSRGYGFWGRWHFPSGGLKNSSFSAKVACWGCQAHFGTLEIPSFAAPYRGTQQPAPRRQGAECPSLLTLVATINVHAIVPTLLGFALSHVAHCIGRICKWVRQEGERRHAYSGWIFKFNPGKVSVCLANTTNNVIRIGAVTVSGVNTLRSRIQQSPRWLTFPIYS